MPTLECEDFEEIDQADDDDREYTFGELLEARKRGDVGYDAIETAREWMVEAVTDGDWWDGIYDDWISALSQAGVETGHDSISFELYSRGAREAAFKGYIDIGKLIRFLASDIQPENVVSGDEGQEDWLPWLAYQLRGKWPCSEMKVALVKAKLAGAEIEGDVRVIWTRGDDCGLEYFHWADGVPEGFDTTDIETAVEKFREDICEALYDSLEKEYEYLTSDEALADLSEGNDWKFNSEGRYTS